jgi:hypothetical protein
MNFYCTKSSFKGFLLVVSFLILSSSTCKREIDKDTLFNNYLSETFNLRLSNDSYFFLILNLDEGCQSCNNLIYEKIFEKDLDPKFYVIIISNKGVTDSFLNNKNNLLVDEECNIIRLDLEIFGPTLFQVKEKKIIKKEYLKPENIDVLNKYILN